MDTVTVERSSWFYPNQKPWMTQEVRSLLKGRDAAFRAGDGAQCSAAKLRGIRKIEDRCSSKNTRQGNNLILNTTKTKELTVDFMRIIKWTLGH